jgi:hypothetical protein
MVTAKKQTAATPIRSQSPVPAKSKPSEKPGGVTTPPETQTGLIFDRLVLKKDRSDESYTRPIRIYVT